MTLEGDVRLLGATRPLDALPREGVQLLAFSCERRTVRAGEKLFSNGDPADGAFFVLEGEIVLKHGVAERGARSGVLIGAFALLTDAARTADAVAVSDSVVLAIPRETFKRVLAEFPESAAKVHKFAQARMRNLITRLESVRRREFSSDAGADS